MEKKKVLDQLASTHVGNGSRENALFFASKRGGTVVAVFTSECHIEAVEFATSHDYYLEGPDGAVVESSWSCERD